MSCEQNDDFHDFLSERAEEHAVILYGEDYTEEQFQECYECLSDRYL